MQIIGRATRDADGKERARFTNLIAEPTAEQSAAAEVVNDMFKAISARLLVIAAFMQDKPALERGTLDKENTIPEELTIERQGKIVRERHPQLSDADQEAVRKHAIADINITQQAKLALNASDLPGTPDPQPPASIANGGGAVTDKAQSNTDLIAFGDSAEPDDIATGTIYVLRSLSKPPFVSEHRMLIHKIGVTGGKVQTRIADAANQAIYLLAPVETVAEYKLHNLSRIRLENIFHRLFSAVQLDLTIEERFGKPVKPKEWFVVPLQVIDEAVGRMRDGTITRFVCDARTASLVSDESDE